MAEKLYLLETLWRKKQYDVLSTQEDAIQLGLIWLG